MNNSELFKNEKIQVDTQWLEEIRNTGEVHRGFVVEREIFESNRDDNSENEDGRDEESMEVGDGNQAEAMEVDEGVANAGQVDVQQNANSGNEGSGQGEDRQEGEVEEEQFIEVNEDQEAEVLGIID